MANAVLSAGSKLYYAIESAQQPTRPTALTGFTQIPNITTMPAIDASPSTHDVTTLDNTTGYHEYIRGMKTIDGSLGFGLNLNSESLNAINALMTAAKSAIASGEKIWFAIVCPTAVGKDFFFEGEPVDLGYGGASADAPIPATFYIVPNKIEGWGTKLTTPT